MPQDLIFAPMGALAFMTLGVLLLIPFRRVQAGRAGLITPADFRFGESARVPGEVSIPNRNYMNLLEAPTLFFPVCLMFFVTHRLDATALALAWSYVVLRAVHSAIHLTYNHVIHRLSVFAASNLVLGVLWTLFFLN
ncbi:MAG: MAPEG family protein [Phenylobacterium sp.]